MSDDRRSRSIAANRLHSPPLHTKPSFADLQGEDMVRRFVGELRAKAANVIELAALGDLARVVERELQALDVPLSEFAVSADPAFSGCHVGSRDIAPSAARAALTHAFGGVAETGTLVLASGPENPTSLAFLPDVHLVAVSRASIYASYEDALGALLRDRGALPRAVNLVSGPSRTGDIGGRIVLGAHGPRHLLVMLYG